MNVEERAVQLTKELIEYDTEPVSQVELRVLAAMRAVQVDTLLEVLAARDVSDVSLGGAQDASAPRSGPPMLRETPQGAVFGVSP